MTPTELKEQIERDFDPTDAPEWAIHAVNLMRVLWGDVEKLRWCVCEDELDGTVEETNPNRQLPAGCVVMSSRTNISH